MESDAGEGHPAMSAPLIFPGDIRRAFPPNAFNCCTGDDVWPQIDCGGLMPIQPEPYWMGPFTRDVNQKEFRLGDLVTFRAYGMKGYGCVVAQRGTTLHLSAVVLGGQHSLGICLDVRATAHASWDEVPTVFRRRGE